MNAKPHKFSIPAPLARPAARAFSLIEVLAVVAMIAVVATIAIQAASQMSLVAEGEKLQSDSTLR